MNTVPEVVLHLVDDLPVEQIAHLSDLLHDETHLNWDRLAYLLCSAIPQIDIQERVHRFIAEWQSLPQPPLPADMSLLLQSVSAALKSSTSETENRTDLDGPHSSYVSLRRTDQALMELINSAQERILIVSFVVYKAKNILSALEKAANRGVEITIILESPDVSEGKIAYSALPRWAHPLREMLQSLHLARCQTPNHT